MIADVYCYRDSARITQNILFRHLTQRRAQPRLRPCAANWKLAEARLSCVDARIKPLVKKRWEAHNETDRERRANSDVSGTTRTLRTRGSMLS